MYSIRKSCFWNCEKCCVWIHMEDNVSGFITNDCIWVCCRIIYWYFLFFLGALFYFIVIVIFHWLLATLLYQLTGHNITWYPLWIGFSWCLSCQDDCYNLDMVTYGVFFQKQGHYSDVEHIRGFLVLDTGTYQTIFLHTLTLICPHIPHCSSNILSIRDNCLPPYPLKLYSDFWGFVEDGLHHLCWNILLWSHPHREIFLFLYFFGPIV